jgi:hypothetical protein
VDLVRFPSSLVGDPVVEHDDLDPDVAAQGVDQMVAADRHGIAVAGGDPHLQIGPRNLDAGSYGRRPAMYRVKAKGIHVVGETARTADPRHHHELLLGNPQFG